MMQAISGPMNLRNVFIILSRKAKEHSSAPPRVRTTVRNLWTRDEETCHGARLRVPYCDALDSDLKREVASTHTGTADPRRIPLTSPPVRFKIAAAMLLIGVTSSRPPHVVDWRAL